MFKISQCLTKCTIGLTVAGVVTALGAVGAYELTQPVCPIQFEQYYRDSVGVLRNGGADEAKADRLALPLTVESMVIVHKINNAEGPLRELYRQCVARPETADSLSLWHPYTAAELCVWGMLKVDTDLRKAAR
jgi:hypothetical protein